MYDYVKGKVVNKGANYLVVEHQGMGYKVHSSLATYHQMKVGEEVTVYLHFFVKEDEHSFYGFSTPYEREVFVTILSVSGIGPKLAIKDFSRNRSRQTHSHRPKRGRGSPQKP